MRWGRTPTDDGSDDQATGPAESRPTDSGDAAWLAREVIRLAGDNDRLRVTLEDLAESLAWRYVVRTSRGLNRDERAAVDRALLLLANEREAGAAPEAHEGGGEAVHPSMGVPAGTAEGPRLRLLK
jgi:hypothetical protein